MNRDKLTYSARFMFETQNETAGFLAMTGLDATQCAALFVGRYSRYDRRSGESISGVTWVSPANGWVMSTTVTYRTRTLRRDIRRGIIDSACFNAMVGSGETYFGAFVLALGLGEVAAGLIATLPLLVGATLQMIAPWGVRWLGTPRRWVVLCASLQALCFVPLALLAASNVLPRWSVFLIVGCYFGSGMATSAAWNTWMGALLPARIRPRLFGWRSLTGQLALLLGGAFGGSLLQWGEKIDQPLGAFALLFLCAGLFRGASASLLYSQHDVAPRPEHQRTVPLIDWLRRLASAPDGRLLLYLLSMQGAMQLSASFFPPYMLKQLHFSYVEFMTCVLSVVLAKSLAYPIWGHVAHRVGTRKLLFIGSLGIVPVSGLWVVSTSFSYIVALQILTGVMFAAYELATTMVMIEGVVEEERTSVLTTYNLATALVSVVGSLLGAAMLRWAGASVAVYMAMFVASSVARGWAVLLLRRVPPFHRELSLSAS